MEWGPPDVESRSSFDVPPNANDPLDVPPATVGPPAAVPGEVGAIELVPPPTMPWSGWPSEWDTPGWGTVYRLTDTAWGCIDLNSSILAAMPPYLVNAAPSLPSDWTGNPDPDLYTSWEEFAKQLFWDFQMGEAFVLATAYYSNNWPARFHVVDPWLVNIELIAGRRFYSIGNRDVTPDILHLRYSSRTSDTHGHGALECGAARLVAATALLRYATNLATSGGVPSVVLRHPHNLDKTQAEALQHRWLEARMSAMGLPAVMSGGVEMQVLQLNPKDMALIELAQWNESRIAVLLGVPPFLMGLPSGGDSLTYSNVTSLFDYHWRASLRTKARPVMGALSGWALPRGTSIELNRDEYVRPGPLERAQTWQILFGIQDPATGDRVLTVEEIRQIERYSNAAPSSTLSSGVLQ